MGKKYREAHPRDAQEAGLGQAVDQIYPAADKLSKLDSLTKSSDPRAPEQTGAHKILNRLDCCFFRRSEKMQPTLIPFRTGILMG
jgi:hypothetical protein